MRPARGCRLGGQLPPFLSDLSHTVSASRPAAAEMLVRNAVNLLATLAAEQLGGERAEAVGTRAPLVPQITCFIELHLGDPDLSPETIARAHHISVRCLHRLFSDEGTIVGRWSRRRRREECLRDLVAPGHGNRTIAAVAGRWGFLSATYFSRVFKNTCGMSPRARREAARPGLRTGSAATAGPGA